MYYILYVLHTIGEIAVITQTQHSNPMQLRSQLALLALRVHVSSYSASSSLLQISDEEQFRGAPHFARKT